MTHLLRIFVLFLTLKEMWHTLSKVVRQHFHSYFKKIGVQFGSCHQYWLNLTLVNKSLVVSLRCKVYLITWKGNTVTYIALQNTIILFTECNKIDRLIKGMLMLIANWRVCFHSRIYGAYKNDRCSADELFERYTQ